MNKDLVDSLGDGAKLKDPEVAGIVDRFYREEYGEIGDVERALGVRLLLDKNGVNIVSDHKVELGGKIE